MVIFLNRQKEGVNQVTWLLLRPWTATIFKSLSFYNHVHPQQVKKKKLLRNSLRKFYFDLKTSQTVIRLGNLNALEQESQNKTSDILCSCFKKVRPTLACKEVHGGFSAEAGWCINTFTLLYLSHGCCHTRLRYLHICHLYNRSVILCPAVIFILGWWQRTKSSGPEQTWHVPIKQSLLSVSNQI